jgi:uncharacterized protein YndB with AHSA1/START domain
MELRVGGKRLICMASPDGSMKMWTTGKYTEIVPKTRLVYTESMADEHGNVVSPSAMGMPADSGAGDGWTQAFNKLAEYIETVLNE